MKPKAMIALLREVGPHGFVQAIRGRAWSESLSFGLACDLSDIPPARTPKIAVVMDPSTPQSFTGFADELGRVTGDDYIEVDQRVRLCDAAVAGLHVATDPEGRPVYAQWLIDSASQDALHGATHGQFPHLAPDETLVEGAYTFVDFRKLGAMAEGMRQLLVKAEAKGAARCYTYVAIENVPSLRGCANAGFDLDHTRVTTSRAGRRRVLRRPPLPQERAQWEAAIKPKPRASAA
ncbi:MAG: hypothetical protein M3376_10035 [Actinomycetota bacterium]|nr:hypothetical protein [Actinomycetota bacterium]